MSYLENKDFNPILPCVVEENLGKLGEEGRDAETPEGEEEKRSEFIIKVENKSECQ